MSGNAFSDLPPSLPGAQLPPVAAQPSGPVPLTADYNDELQIGPWKTGLEMPQWLDKTLAGAGRGLEHTARSMGNLVGLVPDSVLAQEQREDAPLMSTTAGKVGNFIGETATTLPVGMGAGEIAGRALPFLADSLVGQGAVQGAAQGLSTADPGQRTQQALVGALTGGTLGAAARGATKMVNGLTRTDAAQRLLDEGIELTPGQLNPAGSMNQLEQAAESVPLAKQLVEPGRDAAEQQYRALIIQRGAAPGAKITPSENVSDMLQQAYDSYAPLYAQAKGYPVAPSVVRTAGGDIPLTDAFQSAAKAPGVPNSLQNSENEWLQDRLTQLPQNPDSADLLDLRSSIRQRAREAGLKTDLNSGHVATIQKRADQAVTAALQSQLPPEALDALNTADSSYGNYKIIESAVARAKDNLAGLTPQKLSQAVYEAIPDGAYARGAGGDLRDLAQAGTQVFQTVAPPNGSRVATLGLAAAGAMHPHVGIPVAIGGLGLTGTQLGRRLAAGTTTGQQAVQKLVSALGGRLPSYAQNIGGQLVARGATNAAMSMTQKLLPAALAAALMYAQQKPEAEASH